ncbi:MAG: GTPase Era [Salinisphaeraceae bacterium]|nr:GTPase Era [Salinisphaeraceae bacterium]
MSTLSQSSEELPIERSGVVALLGRPNVGKSTLVNALVGSKVSIVASKPQTTRHRITGIRHEPGCQMLLVDVPGLHGGKRSKALNRYMNRVASTALDDVDLVLWLVEAGRWTEDDALALERVRDIKLPVGLVITKIDRIKHREDLLPFLQEMQQRLDATFTVPVSALKHSNLEPLLAEIRQQLPEGPAFYPQAQLTDRDERFQAAEVIREKLIHALHQELPYALTVEVERYVQEEKGLAIDAVIWVARKSHKGIVIGRQGENLKRIGREARMELKQQLKQAVHLGLWVKVREGWADDERALNSLGFNDLG